MIETGGGASPAEKSIRHNIYKYLYNIKDLCLYHVSDKFHFTNNLPKHFSLGMNNVLH